MYLTTGLKNAISAVESVQEYDENVKTILAHKIVLAHILAGTVKEFQGMEPEEIVPFIEGEPEIGTVPVEPGLTNAASKIQGNNTEDEVANEGVITFDVRFYVKYPKKKNKDVKKSKDTAKSEDKNEYKEKFGKDREYVKLLVDVEAQKDFYPGYDLVVRGIYYAARQLSAQKGVEFENSDYNKIKKVYSIWICMYSPKYCQNTIIRYHIQQEVIFGKISRNKEFRYDLLEVLIVNLPIKVPEENEEPNLNGMLKTLLTPELPAKTIIERLESIYHIPLTNQEKGEVGDMCNLGEAILERGIKQGMECGIKQGMERGIEHGIQQVIKAYIELCEEMEISKEETRVKAQTKFDLREKTAEEYVKKYYK